MAIENTSQTQMQRNLLLVDDEDNILSALKRMLRRDGYRIFTASSGAEGLEVLEREPIGVIVSDQRMPAMTGTEFLSVVKDRYPETTRIVLSGYTDLNSIADAINQGAIYKFLTKPWDDELLRGHVAEAFQRYEMKQENQRLAAINRAMVDAVNDILLLVEPATMTIVSANPGASRLLGYTQETLCGMAISAIETLPQDAFYWEEVAGGKFRPLVDVETEYQTADGRLLAVSKTTANARNERLDNIVVIARDLTPQHHIEHQLASVNSRLAAIFEATMEGLMVIDSQGTLAGMNRRMSEIWNLEDAGAANGRELLVELSERCQQSGAVIAAFMAALEAAADRHEGRVQASDGRPVFWVANPQRIRGELVGQVFSFLEDPPISRDV
jgi:PAS domain S-box-containing protein